jgi:hypothetical protein
VLKEHDANFEYVFAMTVPAKTAEIAGISLSNAGFCAND